MSSASLELKRRSRAQLFLGYALAFASVVFVFRYLQLSQEQFLDALANLEAWRIALATVFFFIVLAVNAFAFGLAGKAAGVQTSTRVLSGAWLAALPSKYIPVGVGHVAGRGVLLVARGMSWRAVLATGFFEQGISLFWCIGIAWLFHEGIEVLPVVVTSGIVAFSIVTPLAFRRFAYRPRVTTTLWSILLYGVAMIPYAAGYSVLVDTDNLMGFVAALFAGTVAGVVTVVSPGGLGVRESVVFVAGNDDSGAMLAALIVARLVILLTELLGSVAGSWLLSREDLAPCEGS